MRILFLFLPAGILLIACKKQNQCHAPGILPVKAFNSSIVIEGWKLQLDAEGYGDSYIYKWVGPNGWSTEGKVGPGNYPPNIIVIDPVSLSNSGNYGVEIIKDGCVVKRGGISVQVIPPPLPPCMISNNSSVASVTSIGETTYSSISTSTYSNSYNIYATDGDQNIRFSFKHPDPKPGIYLGEQGLLPWEDYIVSVYLQSGLTEFLIINSEQVYVNKVNDKLQFGFCNARFINTANYNDTITISAKLTLP